MVLDWFGGADVEALLAKGRYDKAIQVLETQLRKDPGNTRLRMQLGDALTGAGRGREAVSVLIDLADDLGGEQAAKAIAILKKIERIEPGRADVESRLADLIKQKQGKGKKGWTPQGAVGYEPVSWGQSFGPDDFKANVVDVMNPGDRVGVAKGANWSPDSRSDEVAAAAPPPPPPPAMSQAAAPPPPPAALAAQPAEVVLEAEIVAEPDEFVSSPLFSVFSHEELLAVMRGLRLLSFDPGDVIVLEGDAGDSLFVLTTGRVKAFVRDTTGPRPRKVRELKEGEFFGEISILSGKPRSATVTCATRCELLELDRPTLDDICRSHPKVLQILEDFYIERAAG